MCDLQNKPSTEMGRTTPMKLSQVAPELRSSVRMMPPLPIQSAFGRRFIRASMKRLDRAKHYAGVLLEKRTSDEGGSLRGYTPHGVRPGSASLWIHCGGVALGRCA